jgi:hypothetical protein
MSIAARVRRRLTRFQSDIERDDLVFGVTPARWLLAVYLSSR